MQLAGLDTLSRFGSRESNRLPQLEGGPELPHALLPRDGLALRSGDEQPTGELLLSDARATGGDSLKDRSWSEKVQVAGEGVMRVGEPAAVVGIRGPLPIHSVDGGLMKSRRAHGPSASISFARVDDESDDEAGERGNGGPTRKIVPDEREPGENDCQGEQKQAATDEAAFEEAD